MPDLETFAAARLADWRTGWSMGSFGAIAEFHQNAGEPARAGRLERATARGAIRLDRLAEAVPVAYETLSPKPHRWSVGLALCLPAEAAARARRAALTELGRDAEAVRPKDRGAVLFNMGLGQPQVDFCVRVADPDLRAALRAWEGRSLFEAGSPMPAILAAHPQRVALTNLGRVKVFQKIGGPDTGGVSPPGPHTHMLPKLLATGRTHSANTPIPPGLLPCAGLHPGNPVIGPLGEDRAFDEGLHDAFEALLRAWGPADYVVEKSVVRAALDAGLDPAAFASPASRLARAGLRNALRQRRRASGPDALLEAWARAFEGAEGGTEGAEEEAPGHPERAAQPE